MKRMLLFLLCSVTACSAQRFNESAPVSGPSAQVTLKSSSTGASGTHAWWHPVDPEPERCYDKMKSVRIAHFSWATPKETTISVPAERPYYLIGAVSSFSSSVQPGGTIKLMAQSVCDPTSPLALKFTPAEGKKYFITQSIAGNACSMSAVDSEGVSVGELVTVNPEPCTR